MTQPSPQGPPHQSIRQPTPAPSASGRTEPGVPLLDHLTLRINELDRRVDARVETLRAMIESQTKNTAIALLAADKAVAKAESATEKRFESVNEFRATLSDQARNFVSKVEFEALRAAHADRVGDLSSRLDKIEGKAVGLNAGWIYLLGVVAFVSTLVSVAIALVQLR